MLRNVTQGHGFGIRLLIAMTTETASTSETSVYFYKITRRNTLEESYLGLNGCENVN